MSGVRPGRCWGGGEDGEDGRGGYRGEEERQGQGKLGKERERESGGHWREKKGEEWGISENRGTSLWCRVSRSDFCPFRIRFLLQSGSPKATERGGWIKRETFVFFFHLVVIKKRDHTSHLWRTVFFSPSFFPIKRDKQRMIHRFHTGVRF